MCVNYSFQYQHLVAEQIRDKNKKSLAWLFIVLTYRQNCQNKCLANLDDRQPTKDNYSTHWVKYPVVSITYFHTSIQWNRVDSDRKSANWVQEELVHAICLVSHNLHPNWRRPHMFHRSDKADEHMDEELMIQDTILKFISTT